MDSSQSSPTSKRYMDALLLLGSAALILSAFIASFW